ncbi:MAG: zinc ABC transporter substrate-binding protein [Verrucomicrobia bacterium]|nr:zinc ABC transporter substrate-binding protein [Verrucomicrobiota bacterium]
MKTFLSLLTLLLATLAGHAKLNVVATLPDYAAIAKEIGGDRIDVTSLAKGPEDAHFVDAKPSFIRVLNKADILLEGGADLEIGWLPSLVANARNSKILPNGSGHVVLSENVKLIGVPTGPVDRSMGDVHPAGNPHYAMDPVNGKFMAERITQVLSRLDSANAAFYQSNNERFALRLDQKVTDWKRRLEPYRGAKVITYHRTFDYFLERFGFELVGTIEPKPGLEPSPTHINALMSRTKEQGVKLVIAEPFRPRRTPEYVADRIGAKMLVLPDKVGAVKNVTDYFGLFDYTVTQVETALKN